MKKQFVLLIDDATQEEQNRITRLLKASPYRYWHWFSDAWLIIDPSGELRADTLRDWIRKELGRGQVLVIDASGQKSWAANWVKTTGIGSWLRSNWGK